MKSSKSSALENVSRFEQVVSGLRSFSDREKGIQRARSIKDSNRRQGIEEQTQLLRREQKEQVAQLEQEASSQIADFRELISARKIRVDKAQIEVRNQVVAAIQATEGQQKAGVQRRFMDAKRRRDQQLDAITNRHEEETAASNEISGEGVATEKLAIHSVRAFQQVRTRLSRAIKVPIEDGTEDVVFSDLLEQKDRIQAQINQFRANGLVKWFNVFPVAIQVFLIVLMGGVAPFLSAELGGPAISYWVAGVAGVLVAALVAFLFLRARSKAVKFVSELAEPLADWKAGRLAFKSQVEVRFESAREAAETEFSEEKALFDSGLSVSHEDGVEGVRYRSPEDVEQRATSLKDRLAEFEEKRVSSIKASLEDAIRQSAEDVDVRIQNVTHEQTEAEMVADLDRQFDSLVTQWEEAVPPLHLQLKAEEDSMSASRWLDTTVEAWAPPEEFDGSLLFGELDFSAEGKEVSVPESDSMQLTGAVDYRIPLRLRIPDSASIFLETKGAGRAEAIEFLNLLSLGWLASSPPGRLSFSLFDPVGLGESFAGLMHLADYEEILINSRIRTQADQIEARLGELCEHMEKVIQMYLRTDYETITEYNRAAGTIAERYHFIVIADFPNGFSDLALQRLQSIATAGARCGVFLLVHTDLKADLPSGVQLKDFQQDTVRLRYREDQFVMGGLEVEGTELSLFKPPAPEDFAAWIHRIGESNRDSNRIEVPFSFIAPDDNQRWSGSATDELTVPIGRSGATKLQQLALGKGTCQHALIAGKTGSGKSTLFHIIVTNLALWCDPDEVEFYLIDFKKGVEFKCYADNQLPHARVIAIESDREFGLSVLQRLDQELRERGELFRAAGVQDVPGYRALDGGNKLPRTLLLIDEFQEFFIEDDAISQQAAVLLDRIVRQGRAFGIHAVLGSQTLGGAFTLARATLGQMTVRIALACNEADAYLIMDDSNPAPRLLTRPGEGIYNNRAGAMEANSPFQVVWMDESERNDHLKGIRKLAEERGSGQRELVVFEGNAPGDVTQDALASRIRDGEKLPHPTLLLGSPNSIKEATSVSFRRQSGANLLFVGTREDVVEAVIPIGLSLLRAQLGEEARLIVFDPRLAEDGPYGERVKSVPGVETPDMNALEAILSDLSAEMKAASETGDVDSRPSTFLFLPSLQRHKKLRFEEDFSFSMDDEREKPSTHLNDLICEGPGWGYHVVASLDSLNNVNRSLGRKAAGEFEKKVLFQMSATDSASLIDSGAAAGLGLSRAAFYDEAEGVVEIFRPYAEAPRDWFT